MYNIIVILNIELASFFFGLALILIWALLQLLIFMNYNLNNMLESRLSGL